MKILTSSRPLYNWWLEKVSALAEKPPRDLGPRVARRVEIVGGTTLRIRFAVGNQVGWGAVRGFEMPFDTGGMLVRDDVGHLERESRKALNELAREARRQILRPSWMHWSQWQEVGLDK